MKLRACPICLNTPVMAVYQDGKKWRAKATCGHCRYSMTSEAKTQGEAWERIARRWNYESGIL